MDKDRETGICLGSSTAFFDWGWKEYAGEREKFPNMEIDFGDCSWEVDFIKAEGKKVLMKNFNMKSVEMNERDKEVMKNGDIGQGEYLVAAKNQKNKSNGQVSVL